MSAVLSSHRQASADVHACSPAWEPIAPGDAHERRRQRAAVAELLLDLAPAAVATLDWDALDAAPAWLALPASALHDLQFQVGAVLCGPAMRLWIDSARRGAARAALGEGFLRALLARPDLPAAPKAPRAPCIGAAQVAASLQATGAAVLLATLPPALRGVAATALADPAPMVIDTRTAEALIERALELAIGADETETMQ